MEERTCCILIQPHVADLADDADIGDGSEIHLPRQLRRDFVQGEDQGVRSGAGADTHMPVRVATPHACKVGSFEDSTLAVTG